MIKDSGERTERSFVMDNLEKSVWEIIHVPEEDRTEKEKERLAWYMNMPDAVKNILRQREQALLAQIKKLETERDVIIDFIEGY